MDGDPQLVVEAGARDIIAICDLEDGRETTAQRLGALEGRLTIGHRPSTGLYLDAWDYPTENLAVLTLKA